MIFMRRAERPLLIKFSGGITAQLLALMSAIYLKNQLGRSFVMRYFPYSTGTYWPLGIGDLLRPEELEEIRATRGISYEEEIAAGEYIKDFPLRRKGMSYENLLQVVHRFNLDSLLRKFRGEYVIGAKIKRLRNVPKNAKSVSGNFPPILDSRVFDEMRMRLNEAQLPNPFDAKKVKSSVVIHYRLGDMRKMPPRNPLYGGHGVVDPLVFKEIMESINLEPDKVMVRVVSDEPEIAIKLLREVGITNVEAVIPSDVWSDLKAIASAETFLASSSQFSVVGALFCLNSGGKVILPSSNYGEGSTNQDIEIDGFAYFDYRYLPAQHWLFRLES
jgi:hypothetical protein